MGNEKKPQAPEFTNILRNDIVSVPALIRKECSGIVIFGKKIRSILFTSNNKKYKRRCSYCGLPVYPPPCNYPGNNECCGYTGFMRGRRRLDPWHTFRKHCPSCGVPRGFRRRTKRTNPGRHYKASTRKPSLSP
jgi:hypothetical protein